jgi:hypothetical protein
MMMVLGAQFFSIGFLGEMIFKSGAGGKKPNIREIV